MKKTRICQSIPWLLIVITLTMILVALGAEYVGIDTDQKWGPFRKGLLIFGLAGFGFLLLGRIVVAIDDRLLKEQRSPRYNTWFMGDDGSFFAWLRSHTRLLGPVETVDGDESERSNPYFLSEDKKSSLWHERIFSFLWTKRQWIALSLLLILVMFIYVGLISVWNWVSWPNITNFYNLLAEALLEGQTSLLIEPSPLLAELENPYPLSERAGIPSIGDLSYFRGKYYLYWGPIPAVFAALWKLITGQTGGDEHIVFVSICCIFLFLTLIIYYFKTKFFPSIPGWLLFIGIIIVATAYPILWVLSWPAIYPAAIAAGQAFLMAGLFLVLPVWDGSRLQTWRLAAIGVLWGLAIGSRLTIIGAVVVLVIATIIALVSLAEGRLWSKQVGIRLAAFILAFGICFGLLGVYNYVRFGDVFETGFRYQLTPIDLNKYLSEGRIFNIAFFIPNLFYYFLTPFRPIPRFPFVRPRWAEPHFLSNFMKHLEFPDNHGVENITGIFFAMPTIVFTGTLVFALICSKKLLGPYTMEMPEGKRYSNDQNLFRISVLSILLAGIAAFLPILMYSGVATRFLLDAIPIFAILTVVGMWQLYVSNRHYPLRNFFIVLIIISLVISSTLISLLIAFSGADSRFDDLNPSLYNALVEFFSW